MKSTWETKKPDRMTQPHDGPEQQDSNNKDLRLVLLPGELRDSPANVLVPDANHLQDGRPKLTDHDEQPGESHRHNYKSDDRRQWLIAEAPLNPLRDPQHGEDEERGDGNIHWKVETLFRNPITGPHDVTDVHPVRPGNDSGQSLLAPCLVVWHMETVAIDKILDQFCVNDEMTAIRAVGEI
jgi:hypothetical protein